MATLRVVSWNLRNYGDTRHKEYPIDQIVAHLMKANSVDIGVFIEVMPNGGDMISRSFTTALQKLSDNKAEKYHQGHRWKHSFVKVSHDEGVLFIWHEAPTAGPNAFRGLRYANNAEGVISGPVVKDTQATKFNFPETNTTWRSLAGARQRVVKAKAGATPPPKAGAAQKPKAAPVKKPAAKVREGRRAAYCAFETNDGQPARTFSVLGLHTPFGNTQDNTKPNYRIQAYSSHLYAASQETARVEWLDYSVVKGLTDSATIPALVAAVRRIDADPGARIKRLPPATLTQIKKLVDGELAAALQAGNTLFYALQRAAATGITGTLDAVLPGGTTVRLTVEEAEYASKSAALVGAMLANSAALLLCQSAPAAAAGARLELNLTLDEVEEAILDLPQILVPSRPGGSAPKLAAGGTRRKPAQAAAGITKAVVTTKALAALIDLWDEAEDVEMPTVALHSAVLGGDFNLDYPDNGDYVGPQLQVLGNGNGYTRLSTLAAPGGAAIGVARQELTTLTGSATFQNQRLFWLKDKADVNASFPGFSRVFSLLSKERIAGYDILKERLQSLVKSENSNGQKLVWKRLEDDFKEKHEDVFEKSQVVNDTNYYCANAYDNFFVRNATVNRQNSRRLDLLSALGNWTDYDGGHIKWLRADKYLNTVVGTYLNSKISPKSRSAGFPIVIGQRTVYISPAIQDAEEAAFFYAKYISDHLPVMVEIAL